MNCSIRGDNCIHKYTHKTAPWIELIVNVYRYPIHELILNQVLNYSWIFYLRLLSDLKVIYLLMSMTSRLEGGLK